jgi:hypothetical protein
MLRLLAGGCALALVLASGSAPAQDKKDAKADALSGIWLREANGLDLKFDFSAKDTFKISAFGGENGVIVTCKYTVKDGAVKAEVTGIEEKGEFPAKPAKGQQFSFTWKVKGDTATLDDFKGDGLEEAKPVVEGDYARKKEK